MVDVCASDKSALKFTATHSLTALHCLLMEDGVNGPPGEGVLPPAVLALGVDVAHAPDLPRRMEVLRVRDVRRTSRPVVPGLVQKLASFLPGLLGSE